jgi:hypothetical protein
MSGAITLLPLYAFICLHGVGKDNFTFLIFTKESDLNQIHCVDTTQNCHSLPQVLEVSPLGTMSIGFFSVT